MSGQAMESVVDSRRGFIDSFDYFMQITLPSSILEGKEVAVDALIRRDRIRIFVQKLLEQLREALGERIDKLDAVISSDIHCETLEVASETTLALSKQPPMHDGDSFGILLALTPTPSWNSPITVGPLANTPEAKKFRAFWHGASHIRKFADNRICDTVLWAEEASEEVPEKIIRFILEKYWGVAEESCLSNRSVLPCDLLSPEREKLRERAAVAFARLSDMLRRLTDIPLSVTNVHSVSPFIRGTEPHEEAVFIDGTGGVLKEDFLLPTPEFSPRYKPAIQVVIGLEYSGKWGDDETALAMLTAAFHCEISKQLRSQFSLQAFPSTENFHVIVDDVVFCVNVLNTKRHALLRRRLQQLRDSSAPRAAISTASAALRSFEKRFIVEQQLSSSLHGVSSSHPPFAPTVQLFKRWLGSRLMSDSLDDYTVELLVAAVFYRREESATPKSTMAAFIRVLSLLAEHNWALKPLIIDLHGDWTDTDIARLESSFLRARPVLPSMVLYVAEDEGGYSFTRLRPSPVQLTRLVALARSSSFALRKHLALPEPIDLQKVFLWENLSIYDVVLSTSHRVRSRSIKRVSMSWKSALPVPDWLPIDHFVSELQVHFGSVALFFYNRYKPTHIGIKFKPTADGLQPSLTRCGAHKRNSDGLMNVNREEVLEDIQLLSKGIITEVKRNF